MNKKFGFNLVSTALQQIVNQIFGLLIFYVLSVQLNKEDFGQLNFALAILLTAFNLLALGIDQVIIKKVAEGKDRSQLLSLYLFHVIVTGLIFYFILAFGYLINIHHSLQYKLLLFIGIGKLMIFFSTPFKQLMSGMEKFHWVAYMSVGSNIFRGIALIILSSTHALDIKTLVTVFIAGDLFELLICYFLYKIKVKSKIIITVRIDVYLGLLKESLPQMGVVFFTSAMSRFDWIFIGWFVNTQSLAEYSFAYKIFEMATFPLIVIAPLLLPRFTTILQKNKTISSLYSLVRIELFVVFCTVLLLNICWIPFIDYISNGKYGSVNSTTIFILSLCLPFLYLNNIMWTFLFAKGETKKIFSIFAVAFFINIAGDILLIPIFKNEGAAAAYLLSLTVQFVHYLSKTQEYKSRKILGDYLITICNAAITCIVFCFIFHFSLSVSMIGSVLLFTFLQMLTKQIRSADIKQVKVLLN